MENVETFAGRETHAGGFQKRSAWLIVAGYQGEKADKKLVHGWRGRRGGCWGKFLMLGAIRPLAWLSRAWLGRSLFARRS